MSHGSLIQARDRAILALGFAGRLRAREIVDLEVNDISMDTPGSFVVKLRVAKANGDVDNRTERVIRHQGRASCPGDALDDWLARSRIDSGPLFRSVLDGSRVGEGALEIKTVSRVAKKVCRLLGLDGESYGAQSLRRK